VNHAMSAARGLVLLGLLAWSGAILAAGISAAMAFPTMESIGARMPGTWAMETSEQWRVVAGQLMDRIFLLTDWIQAVAGAVVVLALVLERSIGGRRPRGWSGRLRLLAIALGMAILAGRLAALAPEMRADLHAYWEAAEAGQWISAEDYRARFQALHPLASRLLTANLACLLVAVACSPAAQRRADRGDDP